ncbi:MAG: hypothetical protein ACRDI2_02025 [Chloroflexota bacterium]
MLGRAPLGRLNDLLLYAEALGSGAGLDLQVGQLPFREGERWVALPVPPGQRLAGSRTSLVAHTPAPLDLAQPLAGLLIDEWGEVVPGTHETTAVAFQFDQPDSRPPQAILLAVPPEIRAGWDLETLEDVVREAYDLARFRAVDPEALVQVGHYLPAIYLADNVQNSTVSTRFEGLRRAAGEEE